MFALICELPSSLCGWLRLINNNSSWLGRNNSRGEKKTTKQSICESRRPTMRDGRRGRAPLPLFPSVLMFANWSFVTQIGAGRFKGEWPRPTTTHGFISGGSPPLMCATSSSADAALIQEAKRGGWRAPAGHDGKGAAKSQRERCKNRTLERSSGQNSYSCKDHTTAHTQWQKERF